VTTIGKRHLQEFGGAWQEPPVGIVRHWDQTIAKPEAEE